jgi:hypothetical protein
MPFCCTENEGEPENGVRPLPLTSQARTLPCSLIGTLESTS